MTIEINTPPKEIKIPPRSKESEMMVLGCMLTSSNSLNIAAGMLSDGDFYYTEHKILFQVLREAYQSESPADVHLVAEELKRIDKLANVGGVNYLMTLAQYAGTSAHIEEYADLVKNKAMLRRMIYTAQQVEKEALENPDDVLTALDKAQQLFFQIGRSANSGVSSHIKDIISGKSSYDHKSLAEQIVERQAYFQEHKKPFLTGIPTGFTSLDEKTTILENGNLIVIAARPAMGKTALALNMANHISRDQGLSVAIISLEMSKEQLVERLLSMNTNIHGEVLKRGSFKENPLFVLETLKKLSEQNIFIQDGVCNTIEKLVLIARNLKEKHNINILIIDYLQLLSSGQKSDSRQYEVAGISMKLKLLARELNIPIIAISQLSRKVEERADKRPLLSDLRDSGQIEQDADTLVFVNRPSYYNPNEKPGQAEIIVAKNRNGDEASVWLDFNQGCGKFTTQAESERTPTQEKPKRSQQNPALAFYPQQ